MDLLSQRYANPYIILDDFIRLGQLYDFTIEIMESIAKERTQKSRWEYYLHKVWDSNVTFENYVALCEKQNKPAKEMTMPKEEALQIIEKSNSILEGFTL